MKEVLSQSGMGSLTHRDSLRQDLVKKSNFKAEREDLSETEHQAWMHIVDSTNYQRLCADRARPFYAEGVVRKRDGAGQVFVEWEDGETEWLEARIAGPLECFKDGDVFGAFVKRNYRNQTVRIETVSFLGERGVVYAEIPQEWPPALQVAEEPTP